jgi:hypothetical protein
MAKVTVTLQKTSEGFSVKVNPWQTKVLTGDDLECELDDHDGLALAGPKMNANGKVPPSFPPKKPSSGNRARHGPCQDTPPNRWCKYNIVLKTTEGDVTIDPDYRVEPGRIPVNKPPKKVPSHTPSKNE